MAKRTKRTKSNKLFIPIPDPETGRPCQRNPDSSVPLTMGQVLLWRDTLNQIGDLVAIYRDLIEHQDFRLRDDELKILDDLEDIYDRMAENEWGFLLGGGSKK